jgi:hypothetical protein
VSPPSHIHINRHVPIFIDYHYSSPLPSLSSLPPPPRAATL